ncbi:MAG: HD domain-containing protein [Proteobacteria bacterium]|nr:HD domain-containing protein [Pseudomonadota bacterium]
MDNQSATDQLRIALASSDSLHLVMDKGGRVLDANEGFIAVLGTDRESLVGQFWINHFVPEAQRESAWNSFLEAINLEEGAKTGDLEIIDTHGRSRTLSLRCQFDNSSQKLLVFGRDITQQRALNNQLQDLLRFDRDNPNPLLRINRDGVIMMANNAASAMFQSATLQQDNSSSWVRFIEEARSVGKSTQLTLTIGTSTYLFTALPDNGVVNLYGADISSELARDENLTDIVSSIPGVLLQSVASPDNRIEIEFISPQVQDFIGYPAEAVLASPELLSRLITAEERARLQQIMTGQDGELEPIRFEWPMKNLDQQVRWVQASGTPRQLKDGRIRWNMIILDVTEHRNLIQQAEAALEHAIHAMSAVLEARDPYTAGHEDRVALIATAIAKSLGYSDQALKGLYLAASIHDIGKIGIPAEILSKPARLNELEFELIKTHAAKGAGFIKHVDHSMPLADMIRQHHERMDGSGYPDGLRADEILPEARIIGVADVVEAMSGHRPYRPALGIDAAAREIQSGRGSRYDTDVATACLDLISDGTVSRAMSAGHSGR